MMKKLFLGLTLGLCSLIAIAPKAEARDDVRITRRAEGHWETRYRTESYYVSGRFIGWREINGRVYSVYSQGYWATRTIPYTVWVPARRQPQPRFNIRISW